MKNKTESFLIGWAVGSIIFILVFSYILGVMSRDYEEKIENIKQECVETRIKNLYNF